MSRRHLFALSTTLLFGCSLVNKFDPLGDVSASAGQSNGGSGAGGAPAAGGSSGSPSAGGSGGSGGTASVEPGLIVVANKNGTLGFLSVLSPQTGEELSREQGAFVSVVRDDENDLWYVLQDEQNHADPDLFDTISLQARKFDRSKNEWTKLGTPLTVPVPVGPLEMGMLVDRLAILTYEPPGDAGAPSTKLQFVVVDTSNPEALKLFTPSSASTPYVDIDQDVSHLITSYSGNNPGGQITLVRRDASTLDVSLRRVTVSPDDVVVGATTSPVGTLPASNAYEGTAWDPDPNNSVILVAMPVDQQNASIRQLSLIDYQPAANDTALTLSAPVANQLAFSSPVVDPCTNTAFVAELRDTHSVFAIPLGGSGTLVRRDLGHSGQQVAFEPYTRSVLAAYTSGNASGISAYSLGGTSSSPSLNARTNWNPPSDLHPSVVLVARPTAMLCP